MRAPWIYMRVATGPRHGGQTEGELVLLDSLRRYLTPADTSRSLFTLRVHCNSPGISSASRSCRNELRLPRKGMGTRPLGRLRTLGARLLQLEVPCARSTRMSVSRRLVMCVTRPSSVLPGAGEATVEGARDVHWSRRATFRWWMPTQKAYPAAWEGNDLSLRVA